MRVDLVVPAPLNTYEFLPSSVGTATHIHMQSFSFMAFWLGGVAATRVRVDPSGDVVMTPTDQAQQGEDANLRKIVAQLQSTTIVWRI